ncbi:MAG: dephospho-CoA kinase [Alistipes sp.]|nr:dephospho-CoA kinase [Candidatus Alistipes equi]
MIRVALCGGIGSGKSTVASFFRKLGISVYISDVRARELMNSSSSIRHSIVEYFGEDTYCEGKLCPKVLAKKVFHSDTALKKLNSIVHPKVKIDFRKWCEQHAEEPYTIIESAILFEAGMREDVDFVIAVLAPEALRVERAIKRDNQTREEILKRINAQMSDDEIQSLADVSIVNISLEDVEKDVAELDARLKIKSGL